MYVTVRNSADAGTEDRWILAGDLVYSFENIRGRDPENPQYLPVGLGMGSQTNLMMATDAMVNEAGGDTSRVIPIHEADLPKAFPSRMTDRGLMITEITLASGEASKVQ
jgi:hypothetical protein